MNRQPLARIPGSRNDAFQQHDPRAPTRRSPPVSMTVTTELRLAVKQSGPSIRIDKLSGRCGIMVCLRGGHRDEAADSSRRTSEHDGPLED
jgi:hypothetical protein